MIPGRTFFLQSVSLFFTTFSCVNSSVWIMLLRNGWNQKSCVFKCRHAYGMYFSCSPPLAFLLWPLCPHEDWMWLIIVQTSRFMWSLWPIDQSDLKQNQCSPMSFSPLNSFSFLFSLHLSLQDPPCVTLPNCFPRVLRLLYFTLCSLSLPFFLPSARCGMQTCRNFWASKW